MKKVIVILVIGLLLIQLLACVSKPQESDVLPTTVTAAAEISEAELYEEFIASREWTLMEDGAGDLSEWEWELTARKIFDFDGDGVDELWIEASEPGGFDKFSGFYTVEDAKVKELLFGYITGGTIGGDEVAMCYDTQTQQHLVGLAGYTGGFGGGAHSTTCYEYKTGQLREVLSMEELSMHGSETEYTVNGAQVTEDEYNQAHARLTKPTDETFLMGTPPRPGNSTTKG